MGKYFSLLYLELFLESEKKKFNLLMEHEWAPFGLPMVSANARRPSGQIDAYPLYPIVSTLYAHRNSNAILHVHWNEHQHDTLHDTMMKIDAYIHFSSLCSPCRGITMQHLDILLPLLLYATTQ